MMRKLFNNRWFIISLAVCSVLLLASTIAAPFLDRPDFSDAPPIVDPLAEEIGSEPVWQEAPPVDPLSLLTMDSEKGREGVLNGNLTWSTDSRRDPFSVRGNRKSADDPPMEDPRVQVRGAATTPETLPTLDALVVGPNSLLAVIGDEVVREGDWIGDLRVTRIEPHGVALKSKHRSFWIRLSDKPASARMAAHKEHDT